MKNFLIYILPISLLLMAAFCESPTDSNVKNSLNQSDSLVLEFKDTLFIHEENVWITFDTLLADSRCPVDVVCVWAGNAELGFIIAKDQNQAVFSLNTHPDFLKDTTISGYKISLLNVLPVPLSDSLYIQSDYSAIISVTQ